MSTKKDDECLRKAGDDEPIFVLRAQDELAAPTVRAWAAFARARGVSDEKVIEAETLALSMELWAHRGGQTKIPD